MNEIRARLERGFAADLRPIFEDKNMPLLLNLFFRNSRFGN